MRYSLSTGDGDVTCTVRRAASLSLASGNGDLTATVRDAEELVALTTQDGDVSLTVPGDLAFCLTASTCDVQVRCELELDTQATAQAGGTTLTATRHGGVPIRIQSGSGDVTIRGMTTDDE